MKSLEINALGLDEMSLREQEQTNGGILPLLIVAAAAVLLSGCTVVVNTGDGDVNVGDKKDGGTDVNTDVGVNV